MAKVCNAALTAALLVAACGVAASDAPVDTGDFDDSDGEDMLSERDTASDVGSEGAGAAEALAGMDPQQLAQLDPGELQKIIKGLQKVMGVNDTEMEEAIAAEVNEQEQGVQQQATVRQMDKPPELAEEIEDDPDLAINAEEERSVREALNKKAATPSSVPNGVPDHGFFNTLYTQLVLQLGSTNLLLIALFASAGLSFFLGIAYNAYVDAADAEASASKKTE